MGIRASPLDSDDSKYLVYLSFYVKTLCIKCHCLPLESRNLILNLRYLCGIQGHGFLAAVNV